MPSLRPAPAQTLRALFTLACATGTGGALQGAPRGLASRHSWRPNRRPGQQLSGAGGRGAWSSIQPEPHTWAVCCSPQVLATHSHHQLSALSATLQEEIT